MGLEAVESNRNKGINMKQGKTLVELAQELSRIQTSKRDFIVPTEKMQMNENAEIVFKNGEEHAFKINNWSGGQVAQYTDIPKQYFDRLKEENKALLAQNVNHGLDKIAVENKDKKEARLVRTIDGKVRGFLSSRYRVLDAHDLLETTLPILIGTNFEVLSSEITERRLYLKAATPKVETEITKGDVVRYGVMISTSDVGAGSLRIEPFITRLVCMNGMVMEQNFKKAHLGRNQFEEHVAELLSDNTKKLNDAAFFATVRDYLEATMKPEIFEKEVNKMREAANAPIKNFDLQKVVELSMNEVGVRGETVKQGILAALATGNEGAGLTKWGLVNAYTRAAQMESLNYDDATELERAGGLILNLNNSQWKRVADKVS